MKNKAITLVRNGPILFPYQERDYEEMAAIGCPITHFTNDYLPLFGALAKRKGKKVELIPFDPIEAEMFNSKILPKWKHDLQVTHAAVTLTYPKDGQSEASVEKLIEALKRWYRKNYVTLDVQIKRTSKKVTVTLRKTYEQPE
jgi:hypothetical protein